MKKIILCLCLITNIVYADEWLELPNEAGGKILFLQGYCDGNKDAGKMVIATTSSGTSVNGCWWYFADMVHVVWKDGSGKTSSFDPKYLKYKKSQ